MKIYLDGRMLEAQFNVGPLLFGEITQYLDEEQRLNEDVIGFQMFFPPWPTPRGLEFSEMVVLSEFKEAMDDREPEFELSVNSFRDDLTSVISKGLIRIAAIDYVQ